MALALAEGQLPPLTGLVLRLPDDGAVGVAHLGAVHLLTGGDVGDRRGEGAVASRHLRQGAESDDLVLLVDDLDLAATADVAVPAALATAVRTEVHDHGDGGAERGRPGE